MPNKDSRPLTAQQLKAQQTRAKIFEACDLGLRQLKSNNSDLSIEHVTLDVVASMLAGQGYAKGSRTTLVKYVQEWKAQHKAEPPSEAHKDPIYFAVHEVRKRVMAEADSQIQAIQSAAEEKQQEQQDELGAQAKALSLAEQRIAALKQKLHEKNNQIKNVQQKYIDSQKQLAEKKVLVGTQNEHATQQRQSLDTLNTSIATLNESLEQSYQSQVAALKESHQQSTKKLEKKWQQKHDACKAEANQHQQTIKTLELKLASSSDQLQQQEAQRDEIKKQYDALKISVKKISEDNAQLHDQLNSRSAERDALKGTIEMLRIENQALKEMKTMFDKHVDRYASLELKIDKAIKATTQSLLKKEPPRNHAK